MSADPAEALYFDGAPVLHVVAFRERQRLARIDEENRRALRAVTGWRGRGSVVSFA